MKINLCIVEKTSLVFFHFCCCFSILQEEQICFPVQYILRKWHSVPSPQDLVAFILPRIPFSGFSHLIRLWSRHRHFNFDSETFWHIIKIQMISFLFLLIRLSGSSLLIHWFILIPTREFVNSVWCIKILSPQEVHQMGKRGLELLKSVPMQRLSSNSCDDYGGSRQDSRNLSSGITSVGSLEYWTT